MHKITSIRLVTFQQAALIGFSGLWIKKGADVKEKREHVGSTRRGWGAGIGSGYDEAFFTCMKLLRDNDIVLKTHTTHKP